MMGADLSTGVANEGRIALLVGGTGGIGIATAKSLAADGMTVVVSDLDAAAAQAVAAGLPGDGHWGLTLDVGSEASVRAAFDRIEAHGPVSVLVILSGVLGQAHNAPRPRLVDFEVADWDHVMAINARGPFLCIREMARRREEAPVPEGRIIAFSSAAAQIGGYQSNGAYIASKGAVLSLVKTAARELASLGVTVNCIAPGPIDTPMLHAARGQGSGDPGFSALAMLPAGRVGRPEEVAAAVRYLASVDGGFVTGATLDINGGLRMQ